LASIDKIRSDCDKQNGKKNTGQFGLFDVPKDETKKLSAPPDTFVQTEPMSQKEKLSLEKELLGIYITENPISKMLDQFQQNGLPKIIDVVSKKPDTVVKFVAIINKYKKITTKKNGLPMSFLTIEDETGKVEVVVFPKIFEKCQDMLVENKPIYIEGKTNLREGNISILADIVELTPPKNSAIYDFVIQIPKNTSQNQLMNLNNLLKKNPNGHRGLIILANGKNIPLSYGVNYNPDLQKEINRILNIDN
jgi:DNA polymerase III subunit alpha